MPPSCSTPSPISSSSSCFSSASLWRGGRSSARPSSPTTPARAYGPEPGRGPPPPRNAPPLTALGRRYRRGPHPIRALGHVRRGAPARRGSDGGAALERLGPSDVRHRWSHYRLALRVHPLLDGRQWGLHRPDDDGRSPRDRCGGGGGNPARYPHTSPAPAKCPPASRSRRATSRRNGEGFGSRCAGRERAERIRTAHGCLRRGPLLDPGLATRRPESRPSGGALHPRRRGLVVLPRLPPLLLRVLPSLAPGALVGSRNHAFRHRDSILPTLETSVGRGDAESPPRLERADRPGPRRDEPVHRGPVKRWLGGTS